MSFPSVRLLTPMALRTILLPILAYFCSSAIALTLLSSLSPTSATELSSNVTANLSLSISLGRLGYYHEQDGSCLSVLDDQDLSSGCDDSSQRLYPGSSDKLKCYALFYSLTCRMKTACEWCTSDHRDYVDLAQSILNEKGKQCGNWSSNYPKLECHKKTDAPKTVAPEPEHHHHLDSGVVIAIVIPLVCVSIILVVLVIYMYRYYYSSKKPVWDKGFNGKLPANLKQPESCVGVKLQNGAESCVGVKLQNGAETVGTKEQSRVSLGAKLKSGATVGTMEQSRSSVGAKQQSSLV